MDQYVVLRASSEFFLADDGSYSGAVEQIISGAGGGRETQGTLGETSAVGNPGNTDRGTSGRGIFLLSQRW